MQGNQRVKSELDLFNNTATQLAIDSFAFLEVHPISSITEKTPLEFFAAGNGEHYLDLSHTILHLQVKILNKNGANLINSDYVAPINYFLNTLFSDCSVFLNDKQITNKQIMHIAHFWKVYYSRQNPHKKLCMEHHYSLKTQQDITIV